MPIGEVADDTPDGGMPSADKQRSAGFIELSVRRRSVLLYEPMA
jgi:hypothetical protein